MNNKPDPISLLLPADPHDSMRESSGMVLTLIGALALLLAHGLNLYWVLWEKIPLSAGIMVYLGIAVATLIIGRIFYMRRAESRFIALLCMTSLVLGPFGAGGILIMLLLMAFYNKTSQSFADWFDTIFPSLFLRKPEEVHENILIGRDEASKSYSVIPFMEVLAYGSETQKMQALSRMTQRFHPSFAPAFKRALSDSSNMIRVQAATAIAKIENQFLERLLTLTALYRQRPRDPVAVLALAEHYDDYAYTGILDEDRELSNREKALAHYQEYLKLNSKDTDIRARIGRLLLRSGQAARAADWLSLCLSEGYESDAILLWHGEALFAAGRYHELRERALRMQAGSAKLAEAQPQLAAAYALWNKGAA